MPEKRTPFSFANIRWFIAFRVCFNSRFYYPIFTILFLDMGLTLEQFFLLNAVWAVSIVGLEVPSGAFADTFGRQRLVFLASICFILELALLAFVPLGDNTLVFWAILLNRIISGAAEAFASGADEALAFDTLKDHGCEDLWPQVLDKLMRIQSGGFLVAMLAGAAVYDAAFVNSLFGTDFSKATTLRFPIYLTLGTALVALIAAARLKEPGCCTEENDSPKTPREAFALTWKTGKWILGTPFVLGLILLAMSYDSIIRMMLTINSEYFRLIELPESLFGVLGALMGAMGLFLPILARRLVEKHSLTWNFAALGLVLLVSLVGVALAVPWWGALPMLVLGSGMFFLNFFLSHYLNAAVDSGHRATVLSFRSLACNIAYGLAGLLYMGATSAFREIDTATGAEASSDAVFRELLVWSPLLFFLILCALLVWVRPLVRKSSVKTQL